MIENLDKISHPDLRNNIMQLRNDLIEIIIREGGFSNQQSFTTTKNHINSRLYEYILGINAPISICDSYCHTYQKIESLPESLNAFCIELSVDYRITYGYKPYQTLDKPIQLFFKIVESDIREYKLNELIG